MKPSIRRCLLVLVSLLTALSAAQGQSPPARDFSSNYYLNPQPDRISNYIESVEKNDLAAQSKALGSVIGFMSEVFRANPDRIERWLSEIPLSKNTQVALVYALWLADMREAALLAMKRFQWPAAEGEAIVARMSGVKNLSAIVPNTGNDLDMFWGAFFASGDGSRVNRILFAYNNRARNAQIDPRDILLTAEVIGSRTPDPVAVEKMKQFKTTYGEARAVSIVVAASALWALGSNSQQHERVREIVTSYLRGAQDDLATKVLARYMAQASIKVIGPTPNAKIFFVTTRDPNFAKGPMQSMIERQVVPTVDKVFGKSDRAFAALTAMFKSQEQIDYQIELVGLKGGIRRSAGKLSGTATSHSIQAAMIPLVPEPAGTRGLHEIVITVSGTETPKQSFRTMVYFDDD